MITKMLTIPTAEITDGNRSSLTAIQHLSHLEINEMWGKIKNTRTHTTKLEAF